jgi:excisionase family DNA binding protein
MEDSNTPARTKIPKSFCTTAEAAARLGVSIRTVQLWAESGQLNAWKTAGGHRRITVDSLERLLAAPRTAAPALPDPEVAGPPRLRILVVEDDPALLVLYRNILQRWALAPELQTARDGFEALVEVGRIRPHLLITDLMMPYMDGFEMVRRLRALAQFAEMGIVAVSGLPASAIEERGGLPAGVPILPKPVPFKQLEAIAATLAAAHGLWQGAGAVAPL